MCMAHGKILLPYYFGPGDNLRDDSVVKDLFGKFMAGIHNKDNLTQMTGFKMSLFDMGVEKILGFNGRVWSLQKIIHIQFLNIPFCLGIT